MRAYASTIILCAAFFVACKSSSSEGTASSASASAPASSALRSFPIASGPRLAILAGQGVGPIRIGANVATIERLMEAPCEEKTADRCRYISRGTEFELDGEGKTVKIRLHRPGRDAGGGKTYGLFNGAIPPDVMFGMLPRAVQQTIGPPDRVEPGEQGAYPGTVAQHFYKGMVIEYDKLPNGNPVMGGVRIPN